ncbi:MAG: pentapeptide repeat-containing protein [Acidimicrobiales bacterium]
MAGAFLAGAFLAGAALDGASLAGASLAGAALDGASLAGASLAGAALDGAWTVGALAAPPAFLAPPPAFLAGADVDPARLVGAGGAATDASRRRSISSSLASTRAMSACDTNPSWLAWPLTSSRIRSTRWSAPRRPPSPTSLTRSWAWRLVASPVWATSLRNCSARARAVSMNWAPASWYRLVVSSPAMAHGTPIVPPGAAPGSGGRCRRPGSSRRPRGRDGLSRAPDRQPPGPGRRTPCQERGRRADRHSW